MKPQKEFRFLKRKGVYGATCKECCEKQRVAQKRAHYLKNPEKARSLMREYRLKNLEKYRAQQREYRLKNPEKERARKQKSYFKNSEKYLARRRARRLENPEEYLSLKREWGLKKQLALVGMSREWFDRRSAELEHKCFICRNYNVNPATGKQCRLAIDHCHKTMKHRDLLCGSCNIAIGHFKDNLFLLAGSRVGDYLEKWAKIHAERAAVEKNGQP
jgi:hypothetical protein